MNGTLERRVDPRTDPTYSLHNLLRTRAERLACALAAIGTEDGLLMASSHPGRTADEAIATASSKKRATGRIGPALVTRTVDIGHQAVVLALVTFKPIDERTLDDFAARVGAILREGRPGLAA